MNQEIQAKLRNVVTQCRKLLEDSISEELEGKYVIFAKKDQVTADSNATMPHLNEEEQTARKDILDHFGHLKARGIKPKEALEQLVREIAFTHLNRLCAYKMMEAREVYVGGKRFREAVSRGVNSNGVKFYLADNPDEERLYNTGHQDVAYRHFLDWLGGLLTDEIGVLFNPNDSANRLYPRQKTLDDVLELLNGGGIKPEETELRESWALIWLQDETIGWVYQYFTPKELRDAARDAKKGGSSSPRNSHELAFRNQFFTPRYVVEFLTDNSLGRIWYEMQKGNTRIKDQCHYMVRRPDELFLEDGEHSAEDAAEDFNRLMPDRLITRAAQISHRPKKDPRLLKVLDPACGSGHFLLYCFDLLLTIYEEAYVDPELGPILQKDYQSLEDLRRDVPRLILAVNLHGIDIDIRATQIAALALWLRCQRAYQEMGLKGNRAKISRSNFVCAEPMPGEEQMLKEFVGQLEPKVLGQVVEVVFDKMELAGEAGYLLKIDAEIRDTVAEAKKQWVRETSQAIDRRGQTLLFTQAAFDRMAGRPEQQSLFDLTDITDEQFFERAETEVIKALRQYAEKAHNGQELQKRLFADDTVRGFAFLDLCLSCYDVILMNPPFGEYPERLQLPFRADYPSGYHDIALCFVSRAIDLLAPGGIVGPLMNRTGFYLSGAKEWRIQTMSNATLTEFVDLGLDVLDTAMVQVAAYILRMPLIESFRSWFVRLIKVPSADKQSRLREALLHTSVAQKDSAVFEVSCSRFRDLPGQSLGYWLSTQLLRKLGGMKTAKKQGLEVRIGLQTSDDFRYLRNWWELASNAEGWLPFAKGGGFRPYFDDISLCVDWRDQGCCYWTPINPKIDKPFSNIWMLGETISRYFCSGGLTYPRRTSKKFNPRLLPVGSAFADKGPMMRWNSRQHELAFLAIAYSRVFEWVMTAQVGKEGVDTRAAAISYEAGIVLSSPMPTLSSTDIESLSNYGSQLVVRAAQSQVIDEVSHWFGASYLSEHRTLREIAEWRVRLVEEALVARLELEASVEDVANRCYGLTEKDIAELDDALFPLATSYPMQIDRRVASEFETAYLEGASQYYRDGEESEGVSARGRFHADDLEGASHLLKAHPLALRNLRQESRALRTIDLLDAATSVLSWSVGVCFGRWDVGNKGQDTLSSLTYELLLQSTPKVSPAMLQDKAELLVTSARLGYRSSSEWSGILPDDPDSEHDIVRQIRDTLEFVWDAAGDGIEKETCKILGVPGFRDYLRKSGVGGLFGDHIRRYSKNRRKAPIYWLLQSSKKNYGIWLYYHRLDKDLLFKALMNYVEPKIRLEVARLENLRGRKNAAGNSGKEAKQLANDVERQEDFLSELRDFEEKLRRAANLNLVPDLNDGVILNIASLHELVPWREAKTYWQDLLEGKYDWSSIGKQLRQKGLVK